MSPECIETSKSEAFIFGTIAVTVVSLGSLVGVVAVPLVRQKTRNRWLHVLIALAAATLSADALLHLIPEALGAHDHGELACPGPVGDEHHSTASPFEDHSTEAHSDELHDSHEDHDSHEEGHESHEEDDDSHEGHDGDHEESKSYLFKMSAVLAAVYAFYIFEFVAHWHTKHKHADKHRVQPTRNESQAEVIDLSYKSRPQNTTVNGRVSAIQAEGWPADEEALSRQDRQRKDSLAFDTQTPLCGDFKPIAIMILVGDAVHNFADGLAIGATFASSVSSGLSTSFAVLCHELPHEIGRRVVSGAERPAPIAGDFVVLVDSGLSVPKALVMNLVSALTAFLGLYIGLLAGQNTEVRHWFFVVAAGMFLYVAWIDMLNHLKEHCGGDSWYVSLALQNVGFTVGFVLMFLIGWFEEEIHSIVR